MEYPNRSTEYKEPPAPWSEFSAELMIGYYHPIMELSVLLSVDTLENNERYLHISASFPSHAPTYSDLRDIKNIFIGKEAEAFQVLPKESEYINVHPYCMHIWHKLERVK
jgi:hypothetical protein